jgi:hypothetical protein
MVQPRQSKVRHGNVGIIDCWDEHWKELNVQVRDILLAGQGMPAHRVQKRMDDKISVLTVLFYLSRNIGSDLEGMSQDFEHDSDEVMACVVHLPAELFRVPSERSKRNAISVYETRKP